MLKPNITIKEWTTETRKQIRRKSGLYVFYLNNDCLYIGVSKDLVNRVVCAFKPHITHNRYLKIVLLHYQQHFKAKLRVDIYLYPVKELADIEQQYIHKLKPRLNVPYMKYGIPKQIIFELKGRPVRDKALIRIWRKLKTTYMKS